LSFSIKVVIFTKQDCMNNMEWHPWRLGSERCRMDLGWINDRVAMEQRWSSDGAMMEQ